MINFIEVICEKMNEQGISIYKLCKDNDISQTTFQNWKNGSQPALDKAIRIIKYLNLSADEIFEIREKGKMMPAEKSEYIKILRSNLRFINNIMVVLEDEHSKNERLEYWNGLKKYVNDEIEKYNEWDKHTME